MRVTPIPVSSTGQALTFPRQGGRDLGDTPIEGVGTWEVPSYEEDSRLAAGIRNALLHPGVPRELHARTRVGWWAWALQRVTGVVLVAYLLVHIAVISTSILGVSAFDSTLSFVQHPVFEALNVALITIVLYHTFNGVRVVLFDVGIGIRRQAGGFWACVALTALGAGASFVLSVPLIFV